MEFIASPSAAVCPTLELQLLDEGSLTFTNGIMPLPRLLPNRIDAKPELVQSCVEIATPVCADKDAAEQRLRSALVGRGKSAFLAHVPAGVPSGDMSILVMPELLTALLGLLEPTDQQVEATSGLEGLQRALLGGVGYENQQKICGATRGYRDIVACLVTARASQTGPGDASRKFEPD